MDQRRGEAEARRHVREVLGGGEVPAGNGVPGGVDAELGVCRRDDLVAGHRIEEIGLVDDELA
jgi:hypothetical protein